MLTSDFDYELPRELIATHPATQRDESRLLVLDRTTAAIDHRQFGDLANYLRPGDLLVMNDSRVMKARLRGLRRATGATVEALLLEPADVAGADAESIETKSTWKAFCRPARKFHVGESLDFAGGKLPAQVISAGADGERILEFESEDILPLLEQFGEVPLPPYIVQRRKESEPSQAGELQKWDAEDAERYQTIYARAHGSVAAPTAGLHFTPNLLDKITEAGVRLAWVTLHVGAGTFKPVEADNPAEHLMHTEYYDVPEETAQAIQKTRAAGGRVVAVGTTTVRTLESAWHPDDSASRPSRGHFVRGRQSTRLLILPGYEFKVVDAMITNFHLPRSSLLMMISAFAGHDKIMAAYRDAIEQRYRFYSYGDAMLIG